MTRKFFAAKVNVNENIWSGILDELIKRIPESIKNKPTKKIGQWTWRFIDIAESEEGFIYGNLSRSHNEEKKVVTNNNTTGLHVIPEATYNSFFIYEPIKEILILEETSQIERYTFIERFSALVYTGDPTIGNIEIVFFQGDEDLYTRLLGFEVVTKIEFDILPPNFMGKREFGDIDEILKAAEGTKLKYAVENKNGINKNGPFIESCIKLLNKAYGYGKSYGYNTYVKMTRKGKGVGKNKGSFASKDAVIHQHVSSYTPNEVLKEITPLFRRAVKHLEENNGNNEEKSQPPTISE